jgi:hypothetical protein
VLSKNKKTTIILVITVAVAINIIGFCVAYPETFKPETGNLARDFSAYYIGEWRLLHNPTKIFSGWTWPGDYQILPKAQTFKYTPSFLVFFAPFLSLKYQDSLLAFNFFQVALIPILAYFVYNLVKDKNVVLASVVAVILLLQPLPTPPLSQFLNNPLHYQLNLLNLPSFVPTYITGYSVVNAHVLQTIFLITAMYFGFARKPWISAFMFCLAVFDPRTALFSLPLLLWYNWHKLRQFVGGAALFIIVTNIPFFFYQNIGLTFLRTEIDSSIISQMYPYDWLPLYAITALMVLEIVGSQPYKKASLKDEKQYGAEDGIRTHADQKVHGLSRPAR